MPEALAASKPPRQVHLPADARVWLISDLHVGDGSASEPFAGKDPLLRDFFAHAQANADALVIAGDGFDLAQAWSGERIYARHRRLIDDLRELAQAMPVYYLRGNHDLSWRALNELVPLRYAETAWIGERIKVEHGNAFDPYNPPGDKGAFWASRVHAMLEKAIRGPIRIPMRKHYGWSTRIAHWFFFRYGSWRKAWAAVYERIGLEGRAAATRSFLDYWGRGEWGDPNSLFRGAALFLSARDEVETLVCGHSHQPGVVQTAGGRYVNTGSWTYEEATYAAYEDGAFTVRQWPDGAPIGDDDYRGVLGPHGDKGFFDWWSAFYQGRLRYDVEAMDRAARGHPLP